MGRRELGTEEFIRRSKELYGDQFTYSEVDYWNNKEPVKLFCTLCNTYLWVTPLNHLKGFSGCSCQRKGKMTTEEFIEKLKEIHGDRYSGYENVQYIDNRTPIRLFCNVCQEWFSQNPYQLLKYPYYGCSKCFPVNK